MDYDLERWPFIARVRRDSQYSSRIIILLQVTLKFQITGKRPFIKEEPRTCKQFEKGQGPEKNVASMTP